MLGEGRHPEFLAVTGKETYIPQGGKMAHTPHTGGKKKKKKERAVCFIKISLRNLVLQDADSIYIKGLIIRVNSLWAPLAHW